MIKRKKISILDKDGKMLFGFVGEDSVKLLEMTLRNFKESKGGHVTNSAGRTAILHSAEHLQSLDEVTLKIETIKE